MNSHFILSKCEPVFFLFFFLYIIYLIFFSNPFSLLSTFSPGFFFSRPVPPFLFSFLLFFSSKNLFRLKWSAGSGARPFARDAFRIYRIIKAPRGTLFSAGSYCNAMQPPHSLSLDKFYVGEKFFNRFRKPKLNPYRNLQIYFFLFFFYPSFSSNRHTDIENL